MLTYSFPVIALALAFIAIGRGAMSGQFLEVERRRDRIARYTCFVVGVVILVAYAGWSLF